MTLQEYLDRYVELASAVHTMSGIELCLEDSTRISSCGHMSHCSCDCKNNHLMDVPYVHIHTGLQTIAEKMNILLNEQDYGDGTICHWFVYRGVEFIQLEDKEDEVM